MKDKFLRALPISSVIQTKKRIWLNPKYQREEVWTKFQKQLLIDSIMRDIDLPKFYFRSIKKGGYNYEVVDGQQRLRSIFDFCKNKFPLSDQADPVNGYSIAGLKYKDLNADFIQNFLSKPIDIIHLLDYSDDDIEEMFLRLQNGTPLNAPEKRRAIKGNMRNIVAELAKHKFFDQVSFSNKRFGNEDAVAKVLHIILSGRITDIRPISIQNTYQNNHKIKKNNPNIVKLVKVFNLLDRSFKSVRKKAHLKKFSFITLTYIIYEMLDSYDISSFSLELARTYLNFEHKREKNKELDEQKQNTELSAYTDAARADSVADLTYRHDLLKKEIIISIQKLSFKDKVRNFSDDQRSALYWNESGKCAECKKNFQEDECEVDHKIPHSRGGKTQLSNAQLLCISCNRKKGGKLK